MGRRKGRDGGGEVGGQAGEGGSHKEIVEGKIAKNSNLHSPPGTALCRPPLPPPHPGDWYRARQGRAIHANTYRQPCPQRFQSSLLPPLAVSRPYRGGGGKRELAAPKARVAATLLGNQPPRLSAAASRRRRRPPLFKVSDAIAWETGSPGPARGPRVRDGPQPAARSPPPPLLPRPSAGIPARSARALASRGCPRAAERSADLPP